MTEGICFGEVFKAQLSGSPTAVIKWLVGLPGPVRAVYEAGPTGFGLARQARAEGVEVMVSSPGAIPRQPGDRIKTHTRVSRRSGDRGSGDNADIVSVSVIVAEVEAVGVRRMRLVLGLAAG
jgi:hypothetical protein